MERPKEGEASIFVVFILMRMCMHVHTELLDARASLVVSEAFQE